MPVATDNWLDEDGDTMSGPAPSSWIPIFVSLYQGETWGCGTRMTGDDSVVVRMYGNGGIRFY